MHQCNIDAVWLACALDICTYVEQLYAEQIVVFRVKYFMQYQMNVLRAK